MCGVPRNDFRQSLRWPAPTLGYKHGLHNRVADAMRGTTLTSIRVEPARLTGRFGARHHRAALVWALVTESPLRSGISISQSGRAARRHRSHRRHYPRADMARGRPPALNPPSRRLINTSGLFSSHDDAKGPATLIIREGGSAGTTPSHRDADDLAYRRTEPTVDQRSRPFEVVEQHRKATNIDLPRAHERSAMNAAQRVRPTNPNARKRIGIREHRERLVQKPNP